jgi:iron complex outermembrane receptor protein
MNGLLRGLAIFAIGILPGNAAAQVSADTLQEVSVRSVLMGSGDAKARFQPGAKTLGIDSALLRQYRQHSVATLIAQVSSVFIKTHGFNSLATLSFRGASSAQSAVYWEGVPLMNGATGISDVSLLPVAFSDSISIQYGSGGALGGSGNVGGALLLASKLPRFGAKPAWRAAAQVGWGSYDQLPASAEVGFSSKRISIRARGMRIQAANDFRARDGSGRTFSTENAALLGRGLLLDAAFRINSRNTLAVHAWQQAYRRQIPRALFEPSSAKEQDDEAFRILLDWKRAGAGTHLYAKSAFMQDRFAYSDPRIKLARHARINQYYGELGAEGRLGPGTSWLIFVPLQYMQLMDEPDHPRQFRTAVAGSLRKSFFNSRLSAAVNGRAELFDNKVIALPGVGGSYQVSRAIVLRATVQRSYRMPTLNELYYRPGGNDALKPEQGWSGEGGLAFSKELSAGLFFTGGLTAYSRHVRDWIIWLGGAIWTPHNLAAVHSRGLETEQELRGVLGGLKYRLALSAAYARSTPTESYLTNDNSIGRQIPYTPRFTGSGVISATWRGLMLSYVHSYTGTRYITADESASLDPYTTGNIMASYTLGKKPGLSFHAAIQNIWDSPYAVVAYRPMPGINYLISIAISGD